MLRVKDNQESLKGDIEQLFERRLARGVDPDHTEVNGGHGRGETRRCWSIDVEGRGLVDESRWRGLRSVALVETERFVAEPQEEVGPVDGETETEQRYLISSLEADGERLLEASREHWQIENGLHWVLDVAFREDHSQVRMENAAENFALLRRLKRSERCTEGSFGRMAILLGRWGTR